MGEKNNKRPGVKSVDCHGVAYTGPNARQGQTDRQTDRQEQQIEKSSSLVYDLQEQELMKPNIKTSLVTMTTKVNFLSCHFMLCLV